MGAPDGREMRVADRVAAIIERGCKLSIRRPISTRDVHSMGWFWNHLELSTFFHKTIDKQSINSITSRLSLGRDLFLSWKRSLGDGGKVGVLQSWQLCWRHTHCCHCHCRPPATPPSAAVLSQQPQHAHWKRSLSFNAFSFNTRPGRAC